MGSVGLLGCYFHGKDLDSSMILIIVFGSLVLNEKVGIFPSIIHLEH